MAKAINPVRYYITCDDDRPVVRSIPVSVRDDSPDTDGLSREATAPSTQKEREATARMTRLVRSPARRAPSGH